MGLGSYKESAGQGITFLKIAEGAVWDNKGTDVENEAYCEETYTFGKEEKVRKGYRYGSVAGQVESATFNDGQYGETLDVYLRDGESGQLFSLQIDIKGSFGKYTVAKAMMIALMSADLSKPITIKPYLNKVSDTFSYTGISVSQGGKRLVLNPESDPKYFNEAEQIAMPDMVKELLGTIKVISKEEMKAIVNPDKKARKRLEEIEQIQDLFNELVGESLKFVKKEKGETSEAEPQTEDAKDASEAEAEAAAPAEAPAKKMSMKEKIEAMRAAKK